MEENISLNLQDEKGNPINDPEFEKVLIKLREMISKFMQGQTPERAVEQQKAIGK